MEKSATVTSKKTQDDSVCSEKGVSSGDGGEVMKEPSLEKPEKKESVKAEGNPGTQKKDRSSTTPKAPSRSTRSTNNPEFVAKQRTFWQKVKQGVFYQSSEEESDNVVSNGQNHMSKRKRSVSGGVHSESGAIMKSTSGVDPGSASNSSHSLSSSGVSGNKGTSGIKKRKYEVDELSRDIYCWVCHREMGISSGGSTLSCEVCPRVYHARCCHNITPGSPHPPSPSSSSNSSNPPPTSKKSWACPECDKILRAETMGTRSRAMQLITMDQLCTLLKFVLTRVRAVTGAEPFYGAVDLQQFPRYREFVAYPMDLGLIDRNIRRRTYGSTEAFFADMKWLVHNSIIFNTQHAKLTSIARSMLKICRQELLEIENCPDCYSNAHTRKDNWFIDVCRRPHILVWAKLKGFPHWPAKAMRINKESCVDVRFFGAHDRAWVPARDCFLYSREMPAPPKNRKKNNFDGCIMEVEDHIKKLKERFGVFVYAPLRTVYEPSQDDEIIMKMLPKYQPVNFDDRSRFGRENLPEEQVSRNSPAISTGTEEESDRDQSVEDESTSQKREYDTTFEDSMEIPSGCDVSQSSENTTQPSEDMNKVAEETTQGSDGAKERKDETTAKELKNAKIPKETKSEMAAKETENEVKATETKDEVKRVTVQKNDHEAQEEQDETKEEEVKSEIESIGMNDGVEAKELKSDVEESEKECGVKVQEVESDAGAETRDEVRTEESKEMGKPKENAKIQEDDTRENKVEEDETKGDTEVMDDEKERTDDEKERMDADKEAEEMEATEEATREKEVEIWEEELTVMEFPDQDGGAMAESAVNKESKSEEGSLDVKAAKENSMGEKVDEANGEEDKGMNGNDEVTSASAKVSSGIGVSDKGENDEGGDKKMSEKPDDLNNEIETEEKEVEEGKNVAVPEMKDGGEVIGKVKEVSKYLSVNEVSEENATSILEEVGNSNSANGKKDVSIKGSKGEKIDEVLEKFVTDGENDNDDAQNKKREDDVLVVSENEDSGDVKLDALIDPVVEPEIQQIIKSTYDGESCDTLPSVDLASKIKASSSKSPEKSSEKAESDTLDREGEENKARFFQSLRVVNIETLYKYDIREALRKEMEKRKENAVGSQEDKCEISNKIDVNRLRESLMTKCASSTVTGNDSHASECGTSKSNQSLFSTSPSESKVLSSKDDDHVKKEGSTIDIDVEDITSDIPASASAIVSPPGSNKGDVGSQLRVLGKLQQRLSFIKETSESDEESTQEKEDENTAEDADSVTGDASATSNSDDDSITPNSHNTESEQEVVSDGKITAKGTEEADSVEDVKDAEVDDATDSVKQDEANECMVVDEGISEPESVAKDKSNEEDSLKRKRRNEESEKIGIEVDKVEKCSSGSGPKTVDGEHGKISTSVEESVLVLGKKVTLSKGKPIEIVDSDRASPISSKKQKFSEAKDSDSSLSRASQLKSKPEEVIEEEVLNREVLKESNMVVVQKTVKTRRLDEEPSSGSAPKRARKGIAQRALIVDRSESPAQDEVFPSMFLDPSVTITVLQEAEKENGGSKEQSSGSTSVEELRTSVNLSNDVSLTMVRGSGALEGLAAMQDGAVLRSSEQQEVEILGQNPQNSATAPATQFRPRARKSFPRPSPRLHARSSQIPNNPPPSMEVRRLSNNSRDLNSPMNLGVGTSQLKTTPSSLVPMPVAAARGVSAQSSAPLTPVTFSSSALSMPTTTSSGLVRQVVSPVMPSTSALATSAQSSSLALRNPSLGPRTSSYPPSGSQLPFTPSEAGPVSAELSKYAQKMANYMRQAIEDILGDFNKAGNTEATIKCLRLDLERLRWEHTQEISELKHNQELVIAEIKTSLDKEKIRLVNDTKRQCEAEKLRAIEETKRKQWCANCSKEALFYCCWNTSYCDYPCQQAHWPRHMSSCAQNNGISDNGCGDAHASGSRKDVGGACQRGAAPPPPFNQLQRPGSVPQESHPEEEYFDEDSSSPPTPRLGTSGGTYRVKRRRCGMCKGCMVKDNCGNCAPCRNSKTHQVCRMRRCRTLQSDWSSGGTSRTVSPEPGPVNVPLETPPLTHASKEGKAKKVGRKTS
ncbi:streptococcal hemagglutinin isoform X2 [Hetaerina americana]|uniref:streptococcal hemagglutinin isoform X2 n=1 Tax=Hetaerina americana TaxID=62018 RepID=UPI003A7F1CDC